MLQVIQFAFIVLVPLLLVAGGVASLFAVGALLDALEHPEALRGRIEGLFRPVLKAPRATGAKHYYKPYWESR